MPLFIIQLFALLAVIWIMKTTVERIQLLDLITVPNCFFQYSIANAEYYTDSNYPHGF